MNLRVAQAQERGEGGPDFMIIDAKCLNCGKEFDGHWSKPHQGRICPRCGSYKIQISTDEYEDWKKSTYERYHPEMEWGDD